MESNPSPKIWFKEEPYASRILKYNELCARNQGVWRIFRDGDGYEGMMIADGFVWTFACQSCPEMIIAAPISAKEFLTQHAANHSEVKTKKSGFVSWEEAYASTCQRLLSLGY